MPLLAVLGLSLAVLVPVHVLLADNRAGPFAEVPPGPSAAVLVLAPSASATRFIVTCQVALDDRAQDPTYCERVVNDMFSRGLLDLAPGSPLRQEGARIVAAIEDRRQQLPCQPLPSALPGYAQQPCGSAYAPMTVEDVRAGLDQVGYRNATVRVARADDPALRSSILFAVGLEGACLVGFVATNTTSWDIVGLLSDGTCLAA
jgi:hypothetical protein